MAVRGAKNTFAQLGAAVLVAALAAVGLAAHSPVPRPHHHVALTAGTSSVAISEPMAAPAAPSGGYVPRGDWHGPTRAAVECPQMDNRGGDNEATTGGPDPTDGHVSIPAIGVGSAPIVRVGFGPEGMNLPRNARDIAWLDQGPFPGVTNNVVLAGHIGWGGATGAFAALPSLRPGDVVTVVLHGKTWKYMVRWSCLFPYNSPRGSQVIGFTSVPSLTMVSCAGTWNAAAGTHNERIVVRAEQIYPAPHANPYPADAQAQQHSSSHGGSRSTGPDPTPTPSGGALPVVPLRS
jgi:sortase (surface protein transpeptidase)